MRTALDALTRNLDENHVILLILFGIAIQFVEGCFGNSRITGFMFVAENVSDPRSAIILFHRLCHKN